MRADQKLVEWIGAIVAFSVVVYGVWAWPLPHESVGGVVALGVVIRYWISASAGDLVKRIARENVVFRDEMIASGVLTYRRKRNKRLEQALRETTRS